jgi:hypothetical protein
VERSGPLERRTPLQPGKPLSRSTPMRPPLPRQRASLRQVKPTARRGPRQTGPAADVRDLLAVRDHGKCVRCGRPATNVQHREGRGMGGRGRDQGARTNRPSWLLSLCGSGNTSGCHQWCDLQREDALAQGYVIRRNGPPVDAATVPVLTADGWQLFDDDGGRRPCSPPEEDADD